MFGKWLGNGKAAAKKMKNKDLMEALIGGSLLVIYADGSATDEEVKKLEQTLQANPNLEAFRGEIPKAINKFSSQLKADFQLGKVFVKRELNDIRNVESDAEEVFVNMIAVAKADGEVSPEEVAVLKEVGGWFGLRSSDYGLPA